MSWNLINTEAFKVTKTYSSGKAWDLIAKDAFPIETPFGQIVPMYQKEHPRQKNVKSLAVYENGALKSVLPQTQTELKTPIGSFKAELVTFHKNGMINRLFPLNGHINGFWTEEDEASLAEVTEFNLGIGKFKAKIISIQFYDTGELRGVTLWPGQVISIQTPQGPAQCRIGFNLYPSGNLKSFEPAVPHVIKSSIGDITAFDYNVLGIHSDKNAVEFYEDGSIKNVMTPITTIVADKDGMTKRYTPKTMINPLDNESLMIIGHVVTFNEDMILVNNDRYLLDRDRIKTQTITLLGGPPKGNVSQIAI